MLRLSLTHSPNQTTPLYTQRTTQSLVEKASLSDLEHHYMFVSEFAYNVLEPDDPGGRMVNVYDLSKVGERAHAQTTLL